MSYIYASALRYLILLANNSLNTVLLSSCNGCCITQFERAGPSAAHHAQ
jgi:hypothetical protein